MQMINKILWSMLHYYQGDPQRIQHFLKVHAFAKLIGEREKLPQDTMLILEVAALVHDVGIKAAAEKYDGACHGKLQEKEGPEVARRMLTLATLSPEKTERVIYLVGHHHTYDGIDGLDYQILVEADFLVNFMEDEMPLSSIKKAYDEIFKTNTGKWLCEMEYPEILTMD